MSRHPEEAWLEEQFFEQGNLEHFIDQFDRMREYSFPKDLAIEPFVHDPEIDWHAFRQVDITGAGRADVVIIRTWSWHKTAMAIIVELKRHADESAVAQALRYCGALNNFYTKHSLLTVPVVGAFSFDEKALLAAAAGNVHIIEFGLNRLKFSISEVAPFTSGRLSGDIVPSIDCTKIDNLLDRKFALIKDDAQESAPAALPLAPLALGS